MKHTAIYTRVSTSEQSVTSQSFECQQWCERSGWKDAVEYSDHNVSGTKVSRIALDQLMADARARKLERVVVWKLDRLGRNTLHVIQTINELERLGVSFCSITERFETDTPMGRTMMTILAAFAQLERDNTSERTKAAIERARRAGKTIGRPRVASPGEVARAYEKHKTQRAVAKALGIGEATVNRKRHEAIALGLMEL